MKKIIIAMFAASSLVAGAPLPALAGIDVAAVCDGSVPDGWQRPGGFCDQNDYNKSLSEPAADQGCPLVAAISDKDARLHVAAPLDPCGMPYDCTSLDRDFFDIDQRDRVVLVGC